MKPWKTPDPAILAREEDEPIPFDPVPVRARHDGWTEPRQRAYIAALKRIASVTAACKAVGKSPRSAYTLRERPGAESFAAAWDLAMAMGEDNLRDHVIDRCLYGAVVPRFRRGRQIGVEHRFYDRLAIAVLSGRGRDITQIREDAKRRRDVRKWERDERARRAAEEREAEARQSGEARRMAEAEEAHRRAWEAAGRAIAEREAKRATRAEPRIRSL